MSKHLEPTDEGAFVDFPLKPEPEYPHGPICPKCKGHGGWNLILNAYPLHDRPDTPKNRHTHCHYQSSCGTCWGFGWLQKDQKCPHEWIVGPTVGRCLHEWTCKLCGDKILVDSSD